MDSSLNCFQSTIADIATGLIFAAALGDQTTLCLSVDPTRAGQPPSFLALSPGNPMLRNQVGVMNGAAIYNRPILVYPAARFVPSPQPEHLFLDSQRNPPIGSLVLKGEQFAILAETGQGQAFYGCASGEWFGSSWHGDQKVAFTSWEVTIEGPGGEAHTLCVLNAEGDTRAFA